MKKTSKTICLCGKECSAEEEKKIKEEFKKWIIEEINIAHKEGQPTSRLTSLYNKL